MLVWSMAEPIGSADVPSSEGRGVERSHVQIGHRQRRDAIAGYDRRTADRRKAQLRALGKPQPLGEFACNHGAFGAGIDQEGKRPMPPDHHIHRHPPRRVEIEGLDERRHLTGRGDQRRRFGGRR